MNLTFHGTFKLNFTEIISLIEVILENPQANNFEISDLTGIGIGKAASQGKVQPIIKWAEFGGLIEIDEEKSPRELRLSKEGEIVYNLDPYLDTVVTSWFFHYNLSKPAIWYEVNQQVIEELEETISAEKLFILETLVNTKFPNKEKLIKKLKSLDSWLGLKYKDIELLKDKLSKEKIDLFVSILKRGKYEFDESSLKIMENMAQFEKFRELKGPFFKKNIVSELKNLNFKKNEIDLILYNTLVRRFSQKKLIKHLNKLGFSNKEIDEVLSFYNFDKELSTILNQSKPITGNENSAWNYFVYKFLPGKYEFNLDSLKQGLTLEFPDTKLDSINPGILLESYLSDAGMISLNFILPIDKDTYCKGIPEISSHYIVGYIFAKIWEREHPHNVTIPFSALKEPYHLLNTMNISENDMLKYLDEMKNDGIIDLMRSVKPFQIVKQWKNPGEILKKAYEVL